MEFYKGVTFGYYARNGYFSSEKAKQEAVIRAFPAEPWWGGMFWWKWDENNFRAEFVEDPA